MAATAIPAIAPVESFLLLDEVLLAEVGLLDEVGRMDGRAITSGERLFSKTHCETLKVRLL